MAKKKSKRAMSPRKKVGGESTKVNRSKVTTEKKSIEKSGDPEEYKWLAQTGSPTPLVFPELKPFMGEESYVHGNVTITFSRSMTEFFTQVKALSHRQLNDLLTAWGFGHNKLMDERFVQSVVYGSIQNWWYMNVRGEIPLSVIDHHLNRVKAYQRELRNIQLHPERYERQNEPGTPEGSRLSTSATFALASKNGSPKLGQQAALVYAALKAGMVTLDDITAHVVASKKLTTKQSPERVVKFYLYEFRKSGLVTFKGDQR